jgi:anti-sigma factor RsiW
MNACVRYAPMIGARPGELSDEDARGLAEHLATCEACQARLADDAALAGMLPDALMAEANGRDFSTFSDGVLERIPVYRGEAVAESVRAERRARGASPESKRAGGWLAPIAAWVRHHRLAAAASALAPAVVAVALILYLGRQAAPEPSVDVSTEDGGAMVLETSEGPMVLFGDSGDGL